MVFYSGWQPVTSHPSGINIVQHFHKLEWRDWKCLHRVCSWHIRRESHPTESWTDWKSGVARTVWRLTDKYKVLHLGQYNQRAQHSLGFIWLGSSCAPRDLGVLVDNKLTMSQQCVTAARDWILGWIRGGFTSRGRDVIIPLCSVFLRPHLQYHTQFSSPQFKKDADRPERVQRKAIKMTKGL